MTIQFEKPLDSKEVFNKLQERIINQQFNYDLWKKVESVLQKFDGQKITKRIETALKKELPEYTINFENMYSYYNIYVWGNGIEYNHRKSYLIGYFDNPIVNKENLVKFNMSWELEESRSIKLSTISEYEIENKVNTWNDGLNKMQSVYEWTEKTELNYQGLGFDIKSR